LQRLRNSPPRLMAYILLMMRICADVQVDHCCFGGTICTIKDREHAIVKTIAIYDDDADFLEIIGDVLTDEGYAVRLYDFDITANLHNQILTEKPDLIILDLIVGETTTAGFDFLKLLRLDMRTAQVPVIMCTADSMFLRIRADVLRRLNALPLEKPFNIEQLLYLITTALERSNSSG
jgi:DNA-binding response OmpR family regulator